MKITTEEVLHTAKLANLKLTDEDTENFKKDIDVFLSYTQQLEEVDTDNITPTTSTISYESFLRDDEIVPSLSFDEVFKNTQREKDGGFSVPKILE